MSVGAVKWSYLRYGCTVLADNQRSYAYHLWACSNDMYPPDCIPQMEDCSCALDDALVPPVDPISDPAPWYDPNVPESSEFLGLMILSVDGAEDSSYTREAFDAFNTGSILARPRIAGRSFVIRGIVMSTSCEGNAYGIEWLRKILEDESCQCSSSDPCEACGEKQMSLRKFCPADAGDCDNGLRTWDSVGVVDGVKKVSNTGLEDCCCVAQEVTFTLQSEGAFSFSCSDTPLDIDARPSWFAAVDESNPNLWYRLGDSGTVAKEEILGNDGEHMGGVTLGQPGLPVFDGNPAALYDGVDGETEAPDHPVLAVGTGPFAVEAMFQTSTASTIMTIAQHRPTVTTGQGWWLGISSSGQMRFRVGDGVSPDVFLANGAPNLYTDGEPHHVVGWRDSLGDVYLSVDGVVTGPLSAAGFDVDNTEPLRIGHGDTPVSRMNGTLDEVLFYAREFSSEEAQAHAAAALTPPYTRCYDWQNDCVECCEPEGCNRCGYDALCTCFPPETPTIELLSTDCFCEPLQRTIECVCIDDIGTVYDTALVISLFSGADAADPVFTDLGMRNVKIRAWDNPDNLPCPVDDETYEAFCTMDPRFELKVDFIPSNATLTIDGRRDRVTLDCDGACRPYAQVVSSSTGNIFPLIANCDPITVCVEFDALNTQYNALAPKLPSHLTVTTHRRWRN